MDPNPILDPKDMNFTGERLFSLSKTFSVQEFKKACKKRKVTINELIMACMSKAIKKYFLLQDPQDKTVNIFSYMPISLRSD